MNWVFLDSIGWDYDVLTPLVRPLGGSQSAMCYLATALARRGQSVTMVTATKNSGLVNGVHCINQQAIPAELFARQDTLVIALNEPGELAQQLRQHLPFPLRMILWTQHAHNQPAMQPLRQAAVQALWNRVVCISDWQKQMFIERLGLPSERIDVLRNAISPAFAGLFASAAELHAAKSPVVKLAYTSTPFRGLDVLMSCFPELRRRHPRCRLAVYSSMSVYQTPAADDPFGALYALCLTTENVDYRGSIAQQQLARELAGVSILAYPNTFAETSCIAVLEALAAGLLVITCDLGALRETCQGFGRLISPQGPANNRGQCERAFTAAVDAALNEIAADPAGFAQRQFDQAQAVVAACNWDVRAAEWEQAAARWIAADG